MQNGCFGSLYIVYQSRCITTLTPEVLLKLPKAKLGPEHHELHVWLNIGTIGDSQLCVNYAPGGEAASCN